MAGTFLETASSADDWIDPVVECYKKTVDRTRLRENLKLTVEERFERFESMMREVYEQRATGDSDPATRDVSAASD